MAEVSITRRIESDNHAIGISSLYRYTVASVPFYIKLPICCSTDNLMYHNLLSIWLLVVDPHFLSKVFPFLQCGWKLIIHFFISQKKFLKFWFDRLSWIKAIAWCYHSKYSLVFMVNDSWTSRQGLLGEFHYLIKSAFLSSLDQFLKVA